MEDWKNTKCGKCVVQRKSKICNACMGHCYFLPMSKADRIRAMSDEELAEWLTKITDDAQLDAKTKCNYQWADWLQSEAE